MAVLGDTGGILERVAYDAYGSPRHHRKTDLDGDGDADMDDFLAINGNWGNSGVGDIDRSGVVDIDDYLAYVSDVSIGSGAGAAKGRLNHAAGSFDTDNILGFSGYIYNQELVSPGSGGSSGGVYTVRFRHYDTSLGRWMERDPLGYVDGMNLNEYVQSGPLGAMDPYGLLRDYQRWYNPWTWGDDPLIEHNRQLREQRAKEIEAKQRALLRQYENDGLNNERILLGGHYSPNAGTIYSIQMAGLTILMAVTKEAALGLAVGTVYRAAEGGWFIVVLLANGQKVHRALDFIPGWARKDPAALISWILEYLDKPMRVLTSEELDALLAFAEALGLDTSGVEIHTREGVVGRWANVPHVHIEGRSRRVHIPVPAGYCR